jgi:hypothetical protein
MMASCSTRGKPYAGAYNPPPSPETVMKLVRLAALLLVLAAPLPSQGELGGQWLKIKVKARGFNISEAGVVEKASYSSNVYMFLMAEGGQYDYQIHYETAPGVWSSTSVYSFVTSGEHDDVVLNQFFAIPGPNGVELGFAATLRFSFKLDEQGGLKKATLRSESGHVTEGTLDGETSFFGSITLTGATVAGTKLPFEN